jgi:adenosylcobinamide kinase/adenosylcobinamide-phosphate guanylyltransferase
LLHLVIGGVRSGKSQHAESLLAQSHKQICYVATTACALNNDEMDKRIEKHKQQRPAHWRLIEETHDIASIIQSHTESDILLIECLTVWLSNLIFSEKDTLKTQTLALKDALKNARCDVIMVSNEVGLGVIPMHKLSRQFIDEAGLLHQHIAALCDRVTLVTAGIPQLIKQ